MNKLFILSLLLTAFLHGHAQYYTPTSPVKITKGNFNKQAIKNSIINAGGGAGFSSKEIEGIEFQVKLTEKKVQNATDEKLNRITELYQLKSDLKAKAGIAEMKKQLEEKKKARGEIKKELKKSLGRVTYYGYYAMAVPISDDQIFSITNDKLKDIGRPILAAKAIEKLNGTFISSLTSVENAVALSDYIRAEVSGSMSIVSDDYSKRFKDKKNENYLLWVGKVAVSPLQSEDGLQNVGYGRSKVEIIDLISDYAYNSKLKSIGVDQSIISQIESLRNLEKNSVEKKNTENADNQASIMRNYKNRLQKIDNEIRELQNTITNHSSVLRNYIENNTNLSFNSSDIKGSVSKALHYFDNEIDRLVKERFAIKAKELKLYKGSVDIVNDPAGEIAGKVEGMYKLMMGSYSKDDNFKSVTEVQNGVTTGFAQQKSVVLTREIESLWVYPVNKGNRADILVVAKFTNLNVSGNGSSSYTGGYSTPHHLLLYRNHREP